MAFQLQDKGWTVFFFFYFELSVLQEWLREPSYLGRAYKRLRRSRVFEAPRRPASPVELAQDSVSWFINVSRGDRAEVDSFNINVARNLVRVLSQQFSTRCGENSSSSVRKKNKARTSEKTKEGKPSGNSRLRFQRHISETSAVTTAHLNHGHVRRIINRARKCYQKVQSFPQRARGNRVVSIIFFFFQ